MTATLQIVGPGVDLARTLQGAGAETVLGRDTSCHIMLPDPSRTLSRRHLVFWIEDGLTHFRVISSTLGAELAGRTLVPGETGLLLPGQTLQVGRYAVCLASGAAPAVPAAARPHDPWEELDSQWSELAGLPTQFPDDEPGWEPAAAAPSRPAVTGPLGSDAQARLMLEGLLVLAAAMQARQAELGVTPETSRNPLLSSLPLADKLAYLRSVPVSSQVMEPAEALRDLMARLQAHEAASTQATRALVAGILQDFEPDRLRRRLDENAGRFKLPFVGKAGTWERYAAYFEARAANLPQWLDRLLEKHFVPGYTGEPGKLQKGTFTRSPRS